MAIQKGTGGYNKPAKKAVVTKIKVSQATIDKIKKQGMTASLKKASTASPEMREALVRMYGASRVKAASKSVAPRGAMIDGATKKAVAKKVVVPRGAMVDMGGKKAPVTNKPAVKKAIPSKTRPALGGFSILAGKLAGKPKSASEKAAFDKEQAKLTATWKAAKAAKAAAAKKK